MEFHPNEIINPRRTQIRREDATMQSMQPMQPQQPMQPPMQGEMSQPEFSGYGRPRPTRQQDNKKLIELLRRRALMGQ